MQNRLAFRWLAASIGLNLALGVVCAVLAGRGEDEGPDLREALRDPQLRQDVVAHLAGGTAGSYDSHPDPDVARVLQPGLNDRQIDGVSVSTNRFGLRERDYALPKPEGIVRVVLLGDSFVFGTRCVAEDRMGALLERYLDPDGGQRVEVLHMGVVSWNIASEANYLRRQLSLLDPDLVVHLVTSNDLDDTSGVRGVGLMSRATPQAPGQADSLCRATYGMDFLGLDAVNALNKATDDESRRRYGTAAGEITRLRDALRERGAGYLLIARWHALGSLARELLGSGLEDDEFAYLSPAFIGNAEFWVAPDDAHWNRAGMEQMARLCYGLIQQRELLPVLALEEKRAASETVRRLHERGKKSAERFPGVPESPLDGEIEGARIADEHPEHFYFGIDEEGRLGPRACLVLRRRGDSFLEIRVEGLPRPELGTLHAELSVDRLPLGSLSLGPGVEETLRFELPDELPADGLVVVRIDSDDYVYTGEDLRHCVSLRLVSLRFD